jgi:hypothetical protein
MRHTEIWGIIWVSEPTTRHMVHLYGWFMVLVQGIDRAKAAGYEGTAAFIRK